MKFSKTSYGRTFEAEAYSREGVWYWASNNAPVPLDAAKEYGIPVNHEAQKAAIDAYTAEALRHYRENYKGPSAEQRAEARAAHGPGVTLVDIITGHKWTT